MYSVEKNIIQIEVFCLSQVLKKRQVYPGCDRNNFFACNIIVVWVDCCVWCMYEIVKKLSEENFFGFFFGEIFVFMVPCLVRSPESEWMSYYLI